MSYRRESTIIKEKGFPAAKSSYYFFFAALSGLCFFFGLLAHLYIPGQWPALWFVTCNAAVFVLAGYDKAVAGSGAFRVPEAVLFTGALLGGAAGLLLAMKLFRHKTRKASFQFVLAVIIVVQVAVWRYFLMDL